MKSKKKGGDDTDTGFEQLYNTYYMQVYSFMMTLAKKQDLAEELTQKAFFKAMTTGQKYRGESSEFTWLCSIAKNLWIDETRAQSRFGEVSGENARENASDLNIENALTNEDSAFRIHQVLHDLDEPYKEVFQLRVFGELPFLKIADLFGKTENWARVTYHRARLKIQERMENES